MVFYLRGRRYRVGVKAWRRIVALALVMGAVSFAGTALRAVEMNRQVRALEARLQAQRQRNEQMENALRQALSLDAIESRARSWLGLVRPGEEVFEPAYPVPADDPYRVPSRR
ncbi:MAG: septum formation initiator family protein [Bacillota bacterium]